MVERTTQRATLPSTESDQHTPAKNKQYLHIQTKVNSPFTRTDAAGSHPQKVADSVSSFLHKY